MTNIPYVALRENPKITGYVIHSAFQMLQVDEKTQQPTTFCTVAWQADDSISTVQDSELIWLDILPDAHKQEEIDSLKDSIAQATNMLKEADWQDAQIQALFAVMDEDDDDEEEEEQEEQEEEEQTQ